MLNFTLPLLAYCFGSISSAIIVCRIMRLPDPRTSGSNNPGATNVLRIGGKKAAAITLIGDLLKGLVPMLIAKMLTDNATVIALVGVFAFMGHLYPVFFGYKGGKGVATATGVFIGLSWSLTLVLLAIWLSMAVLFRYSSLAALTAAALAPVVVLWLLPGLPFFLLTLVIAVFLFWRHWENLSRLLSGQENKIGN